MDPLTIQGMDCRVAITGDVNYHDTFLGTGLETLFHTSRLKMTIKFVNEKYRPQTVWFAWRMKQGGKLEPS